MATPKRRSSRLRTGTPQREAFASATPAALSVLVEREETPRSDAHVNIDAITSPMPGTFPNVATPCRRSDDNILSQGTTSPVFGSIEPDGDEMHPKHHQNTEKKLESTKRLSNAKTKAPSSSPNKKHLQPATSSLTSPDVNLFSSPTFEFRCKRPSTDMSEDARKIMDELRDQAAKIKMELETQRDEQAKKDAQAQAFYGLGNRRIATPKGKVSRFSDVHMAQFRKMDSIANHASAFRVDPTKTQSPVRSLKRTNSKANLAENSSDSDHRRNVKQLHKPNKEVVESPVKRFKQRHEDIVTSLSNPSTPVKLQRSQSGVLTPPRGISTPPASSLARSNSVKSVHSSTSKIPTIHARTPSIKSPLTRPSLAKTDVGANHKFRNGFASRLGSVKSILRKPQLRYSDDPAKLAAGTHLSPQKQNVTKAQTSAESPCKKVYFSPSPEIFARSATGSPSSAAASPTNKQKIAKISDTTKPVTYPSLYPVPSNSEETQPARRSGSELSPTKLPTPQQQHKRTVTTTIPLAPPGSAGPGDFTFRFASPGKQSIFFADPSSPTAHVDKKTIRPVPFGDASATAPRTADSEPLTPCSSTTALPFGSAPHGLSNKKRKRQTEDHVDQGDDKENTHMNDTTEIEKDVRDGHIFKKARLAGQASSCPSKSPVSTKNTNAVPGKGGKIAVSIPSSRAKAGKSNCVAATASGGAVKARGILSRSRLNALARPKERK